ncbi:Dynein assembly factor 1, axonemal homolog [Gryllus bimaculatus]|nr:Dynein assembly factor 1, axonemal homolog [Gryllus bimaculatus]
MSGQNNEIKLNKMKYKSSGVLAKKNKDQTNYDFLRKKTQLMLHDQKIDDIGDFSICRNLTILYLHNNCLTEIKYLDHAINLTHLYLQNNKISKIENLEKLTNLCKLYLGFNEISVVEGLEAQENLEELHLEKQRLAEGEELHFDPRSMDTLARNFLRGMQSCHRRASETALPTAVDPEPLLHALAPEVGEMALRLPPAVRRAVSRTLLEETAAAASAFGFGAGAGGGGGGGGGASSLALPLPSAPLHPTFPAWRQPQTPLVMEGGGDGVCGLGDGSVGVVGLAGPKGRVRAKVPRPFWRHRAATGPRNPPSRTSSTCPLRLPEL